MTVTLYALALSIGIHIWVAIFVQFADNNANLSCNEFYRQENYIIRLQVTIN